MIQWKKNKSIPIGVEDSFFNIIGNKLVFSCGYNGGICFSYDKHKTVDKKDKYVRSLKKSSYVFDINENNEWKMIDDFPGMERQCGRCAKINDKIYMYGGYYFVPSEKHQITNNNKKQDLKSFDDGYSLEYKNNKFIWEKLPDLPEKLTNLGMTSCDNYIYICGGGYISTNNQAIVNQKINGKNIEYGRYLWRLNVNKLKEGWEKISEFPGTLRYNHIFKNVNGIIYVLGGIMPNNAWIAGTQRNRFFNVCDNWKYIINENRWAQLTNISDGMNNWGYVNDNILYKSRYLVILTGCAYEKKICFDKVEKNKNFVDRTRFTNNIIFYDTVDDVVINCKTKLFCKLNNPMFVVDNDKIYLIGSESVPYVFENEKFGVHADVFAVGVITGI